MSRTESPSTGSSTRADRATRSGAGREPAAIAAPTGAISDAPEEHYQFSVAFDRKPGDASKEHTIAVRAYDRFDNVGSAKTTVKAP